MVENFLRGRKEETDCDQVKGHWVTQCCLKDADRKNRMAVTERLQKMKL